MREKHVPYAALRNSLTCSGCPICRLLFKRKIDWIESLFHELASDAQVRGKLGRRGFALTIYETS